jgi:hypothetical protein
MGGRRRGEGGMFTKRNPGLHPFRREEATMYPRYIPVTRVDFFRGLARGEFSQRPVPCPDGMGLGKRRDGISFQSHRWGTTPACEPATCVNADARTQGRADARTHGRTDARTHALADARTHGRTDARARGRADARARGRTRGRVDARTHARAHRRAPARVLACACAGACRRALCDRRAQIWRPRSTARLVAWAAWQRASLAQARRQSCSATPGSRPCTILLPTSSCTRRRSKTATLVTNEWPPRAPTSPHWRLRQSTPRRSWCASLRSFRPTRLLQLSLGKSSRPHREPTCRWPSSSALRSNSFTKRKWRRTRHLGASSRISQRRRSTGHRSMPNGVR